MEATATKRTHSLRDWQPGFINPPADGFDKHAWVLPAVLAAVAFLVATTLQGAIGPVWLAPAVAAAIGLVYESGQHGARLVAGLCGIVGLVALIGGIVVGIIHLPEGLGNLVNLLRHG